MPADSPPKPMTMIGAIALLFSCQLLGDSIHHLTGLPLPGPVIGMLILLVWLGVMRRERPTLSAVSGWLTAHLSIMFIPAAVGLIEEGNAIARYGVGLVVATSISVILTMVVSAFVFRWAVRRIEPEDGVA